MHARFATTRKFLTAAAALATCLGPGLAQTQDFYLHNGDRVTFYGDSITAQRFYTRDVQDFAETRYPALDAAWHNAGVPGDKVTGGFAGNAEERVNRDVQPWHPTVITVMLGMNDGGYMAPDPAVFAAYQSGYEQLLNRLRSAAPGARITLIENTPYDEITHGTEFAGYESTTEQNAHATPSLGQRENLPVIDDCGPVKELLERAKAADPSLAALLVPDRIHPSEPLHWIMAEAVMRAWHVDPVVTSVAISGSNGAVARSQRTQVSAVTQQGGVVAWDQLDQALPLPLNFDQPLMEFVLRISDLADWDREMLEVTDLRAGNYVLAIDGKSVGTFAAAELAQGVNLALRKTPMWDEAREYDSDLEKRSHLEDAAFILTAETRAPANPATIDGLRAGEDEAERDAQKELHIGVHHYRLSPAP